METQEKKMREINLAELFWQMIFKWRPIICFGILFAVLLCGMKYTMDMRSYRASQNIDTEQLASELTEEERQQVTQANNLSARIREYEDYLESSTCMKIDPYHKPMVELQYYVDSEYTFNYTEESKNDFTSSLMTLYYNYIMSGEMSQNIINEAKLSINQADLSELWGVSQIGNSISIKIICPEKDKMDMVATSIKTHLSSKEAEFQDIGPHKLKLLNESQNIVVDNNLIDRKNTISNNISTMSSQLKALKTNMNSQQLLLLQSEENESKDTEKAGFNLKFMILGGFFGVFLVCFWVVCKMLFTARLQSSDEIRSLYNIRLLGEITVPSKKHHFLSVIDDKLMAIKNRKKKRLSMEQQIKMIATNLSLSCRQQNIDCIYLTGSEYENADTKILSLLKKELSAQNIQLKEGGNIFYDTESLKQSSEIGNILLVEQKGQSIYDEISNELSLAKEQNTRILGAIVLV